MNHNFETILVIETMVEIESINPFKPNEITNVYQVYQSITVLRVVGWYFSFLFKFSWNIRYANSGDYDQTPRSVNFDLGLHCLPMPHKKGR